MFASIVGADWRLSPSPMSGYERQVLTYPPSDFVTAVRRAEWYQHQFDPPATRYDWRVAD